jgi:DNA-binding NtrC family response regulator
VPETSKPRVFVVDDEPVIATTLTLILNASGFHAESFTNPLDALSASTADLPDLLVTDVHMPQMFGIELAVQMMARNPKCKVLLFSGQASTASLLEKARSQGKDFTLLAKPVHPPDLLREISQILSQ